MIHPQCSIQTYIYTHTRNICHNIPEPMRSNDEQTRKWKEIFYSGSDNDAKHTKNTHGVSISDNNAKHTSYNDNDIYTACKY